MNEKEIVIPQFGMETEELAWVGIDAGGLDSGLISRDEITVIIYEVDGLYLTEDEYHAYLQEQSEIYQSQLDAYNEAVSQAEAVARMEADEFVASLKPDVSDRVEDYLEPQGIPGANRAVSGSEGQLRPVGTGEGDKIENTMGNSLSFLPAQKGVVPEKETGGINNPLPADRPELPALFREDDLSDDRTRVTGSLEGLSAASAMPGLSGYGGEEGKNHEGFTRSWRGWPERKSVRNNRVISGALFEPAE